MKRLALVGVALVAIGAVYSLFDAQWLAAVPRTLAEAKTLVAEPEAPEATPVAAPVDREPAGPPGAVSALGRLEPQGGIRRVAGPSDLVVVVEKLEVEAGDRVDAGDLLAVVDTADVIAAKVRRIEAELVNARRELARSEELNRDQVVPDSARDRWETEVAVLEAELGEIDAELERSRVYAPISGQVLEIHTHAGERVGEDGILELARTHRMIAVAEVYETDIGHVRRGQPASVTSPALPAPLRGTVDRIHLKVAKQDALGTDPAARKDARVIEVDIRLDDADAASSLTNLQVEVVIDVSAETD